jgi:signal transduction histidine kinase
MTSTAPTLLAPPPVRSVRQWAIAAAQSLVTGLIGLFIFLIVFGFVLEEFHDEPPAGLLVLTLLDAAAGIAASLVIGPLRFLPAGRLHTVVHLLLTAAAGIGVWSVPAAAIALYRIGMRRRPTLDVLAFVVLAVSSTAILLIDSRIRGEVVDVPLLATVGILVICAAVPLLIGRVVGTSRELIVSLRERAVASDRERETAERERAAAEGEAAALVRERDADAARVRAEERAALARDVHDSISHHLATIALHAGAMSYREDLPAEELRRISTTIRDGAQQANRELRTVLKTLRTAESDAPLATAPTLDDIVGTRREEGQDVTLRWEGLTPEDLAARERGTVVALARILTEATTNAAKHAPGAPLSVALSRHGDRLLLTARNPMPDGAPADVPSTGHGLIGVEERARLLGGDAQHAVHEGSFEMQAWVPW